MHVQNQGFIMKEKTRIRKEGREGKIFPADSWYTDLLPLKLVTLMQHKENYNNAEYLWKHQSKKIQFQDHLR